jgi:hypothetical protein
MDFHDENFVNDRIISIPAFDSLITILRVAVHPEHGPLYPPVVPMKDL